MNMHLAIWWMRRQWAKGDSVRDAGLLDPASVEQRKDIRYAPGAGRWHLLDVYRPKDAQGLLPTIVSFHGGGWFYGDKELYSHYCLSLAERGFAVVNFNYRLAPEHRFPQGLSDAAAVFRWIRDAGKDEAIDPGRLFFVGDSAGAQLAFQYAALLRDPEYRKAFAFDIPPLPPLAVALNCGLYRIERGKGRFDGADILQRAYLGAHPSDAVLDSLDALGKMNAEFPPTFLMTSVNDPLSGESAPLKERLEELGIPHVYREYGQGIPEAGHVFHVNQKLAEGRRCNDDECAFFRGFLK